MHDLNERAFAEWCEWRAGEKRKKCGPVAQRRQIAFLTKYPESVQEEIIDSSIRNGYQGLFPPKGATGSAIAAGSQSTRSRTIQEDLADTSWAN